ncbi:hypothetical protein [Cupriavidus sp. DF5525]
MDKSRLLKRAGGLNEKTMLEALGTLREVFAD